MQDDTNMKLKTLEEEKIKFGGRIKEIEDQLTCILKPTLGVKI